MAFSPLINRPADFPPAHSGKRIERGRTGGLLLDRFQFRLQRRRRSLFARTGLRQLPLQDPSGGRKIQKNPTKKNQRASEHCMSNSSYMEICRWRVDEKRTHTKRRCQKKPHSPTDLTGIDRPMPVRAGEVARRAAVAVHRSATDVPPGSRCEKARGEGGGGKGSKRNTICAMYKFNDLPIHRRTRLCSSCCRCASASCCRCSS